MSEWSSCPECGTERENLCACLNPKCADYVAMAPSYAELERTIGTLREQLGTSNQFYDQANRAMAILEKDRDTLARWKSEHLQVTAWWAAVDDYVRKHPDCKLGEDVSASALKLLQAGDLNTARLNWILDHGYALDSEIGRINLSGSRETVLAAIDAGRHPHPDL